MIVGLGCMRIADEAVLTAAEGLTLLDTADAYGDAAHDSERLVARALAGRPRPEIATKVGLVRPEGRWENDGRARHLVASAEESAAILGGIDLLQLHAVDPRVPLATSVRALAGLVRDGVARALGVCNLTVPQLEEACRLAPLTTVQTRWSALDEGALRDGVVAWALARGLRVLAYRPLGGERARGRIARDERFAAIAATHGATPEEVALAWLASFGVIPLPGPSRVETARSCARAAALRLDEEELERLDARLPGAAELRGRPSARPAVGEGDVVLLGGIPAAGKSTLAADYVARGYARLNRDLEGGDLDDLAARLDEQAARGTRRFVLDNTYGTRRSRAAVLEAATRHGLPARVLWLSTSLEDAQVNACERMLAEHGRLLEPAELRRRDRIGPRAQFNFRRELEPPSPDEGFTAVEEVAFTRRAPATRIHRALILDLDAALWVSRSGARAPTDADDVEVPAARVDRLRAETAMLLGVTWLPGVTDVAPLADRLRALTGLGIDVVACHHPAGPPVCWCRKPLPGMGVTLAARHDIDLSRSLHVGGAALDRTWAERLGMAYVEREAFY